MKLRAVLFIALTLVVQCVYGYQVTFRLQMTGVTGFSTPEVNGTFNGWCGACNPMNDNNNDGIWETTIDLPAGYYEYKFSADNWSQQEALPVGGSCTATSGQFTNRTLQVTSATVLPLVCWSSCTSCAAYNVTFAVDMSTVSNFTTPYVSGTFNSWCGNCHALSDADLDGIWTGSISLAPGYYEYKFSYDNWAGSENLVAGSSCTVTNFGFTNRSIQVVQDVSLPAICWGTCTEPGASNGPPPTIQIALTNGTNPSCVLSDLTFTATVDQATTTPSYQWYLDGQPVGNNSNTYTGHQFNDGQTISCQLIGGNGCGSTTVVTSNSIVIQRQGLTVPSVSITSDLTSEWCTGDAITFTAAPINGGSSPQYAWTVDGVAVGTNSSIYTTSAAQSGQEIKCTMTSNATCQQLPWQLIWNDEFDGSTLDLSKWYRETGATGWGNNEWQNYTTSSNNIQVQDGQLHIIARNDGPVNQPYTSARLITKNLFSYKYGRITGRMQIPTGQGIWPAFWMLGANIDQVPWPGCGEIDIMEHINNEARIYGTTHYNNNGWTYNSGHIDTAVDGYHEYMVEWDSLLIRFFMDGIPYHEHVISSANGSTEEFTKPFFLLLNVAVGGNWPGYPDGSTVFPVSLDVDYVRVWQANANSSNSNVESNSLFIPVASAQFWYLDADNDGYGNSNLMQWSCDQPMGYASQNGDCNDNNALIHPNATENVCNGLDDNCNAVTDEGRVNGCTASASCNYNPLANCDNGSCTNPVVWYLDADGDQYYQTTQNACTSPGAGWTNVLPIASGDCNDTNSTIHPTATEQCGNGIDDDCDGLTDENCGGAGPINDGFTNAMDVSQQIIHYPNCQWIQGDCNNASNSIESTNFNGPDVWYRFVALTTGVRITVQGASMDAGLELMTSSQVVLSNGIENATGTGLNEIMNITGLSIGQVYYLSIGSTNQVGSTFSFCIQYLLPSKCNTNTSLPLNLCSVFKAQSCYASTYTYQFVPIDPWIGGGSVTMPGSVQLVHPQLNLLPGASYAVTVAANYQLLDGAGNTEILTIATLVPCTVTIQSNATLAVRSSQQCNFPASLTTTTFLRADPFTCGATSFTFRFTQAFDCTGTAVSSSFELTHTSRILQLNFNGANTTPQGNILSPQEYYNVEVRPNFGPGGIYPGNWGPTKTIFIGGPSSLLYEETTSPALETEISDHTNFVIYPNPLPHSQNLHIQATQNMDELSVVKIFDAFGRMVFQTELTFGKDDQPSMLLPKISTIGTYILEIQGQTFNIHRKLVVE